MEQYIKKLFSEVADEQGAKNPCQVLVLHDEKKWPWEEVKKLAPLLPRGWYELSRVSKEDRVEFTRDYWITQLPYHPEAYDFITTFFSTVDDIGVLIAKKHFDDPYEPHMIYALKEGKGFFHGAAPLLEEDEVKLHSLFPGVIFPVDYLAFLRIHDGFSKSSDSGIIPTSHLKEVFLRFQKMVNEDHVPLTTKGQSVNPHSLIPFYESFGMPFFQCFWKEWYPENEMGNVYYSEALHSVSDPVDNKNRCMEEMAFTTFMDWLFFYLEAVL